MGKRKGDHLMDQTFELSDMAELFEKIETDQLDNAARLQAKSRKLAQKFFTTLQKEQINEERDEGE